MTESFTILGKTLEFDPSEHIYKYDGHELPSITRLLKNILPDKYKGVDENTLNIASIRGTYIHMLIEEYEKCQIDDSSSKELRNYKFLKKNYKFEVVSSETPVVLFDNGTPIAGGMIDLVIKKDDKLGIADIKTTSVLDKEYVTVQTNLYRIAYQQSYGEEISFLKAIWLKEDKRRFVNLPINEHYLNEALKTRTNKSIYSLENNNFII